MATRLFSAGNGGANGYTVSPAPSFYNALQETTASTSSSGNSIILAAGASGFSYTVNARFATAIPNYSGTITGSWRICRQFQAVTPTNVYTKVRVHRATLSGTAYTIVASSEWSGEVLTNKINQMFEMYLDQVDLGTWSSSHALVIEYNYRNAGASSITPQPVGGFLYQNAIYSPLSSSSGYGHTALRSAGQRPYIYSQGGIRGTSRYLIRQVFTTTSSGTATGTGGSPNFNGTVTGSSTSSGTIAAGKQGYRGTITGSSTSSGTIAAGRQGYVGSSTGSATSSGTIAAGRQGYAGSSIGSSASNGTIATGTQGYAGSTTGSSTSSGTVNGTPGPGPEPDTGGALPQWWYIEQERQLQPEPLQILALTGAIRAKALYITGRVRGRAGFIGALSGTNRVESFITSASVGYSGEVPPSRLVADGRISRGRVFTTNELLILIGEL